MKDATVTAFSQEVHIYVTTDVSIAGQPLLGREAAAVMLLSKSEALCIKHMHIRML